MATETATPSARASYSSFIEEAATLSASASASASTASSSTVKKNLPFHDVFINCCGIDFESMLARTIYYALTPLGIRVFLNREELGLDEFIPSLVQGVMRTSFLHILIFSPSYAKSPWCLAELSFMLDSGATIIPIFFNVKPSDLRRVGEGKYADAFSLHEANGRYSPQKLKEWKRALRNVSFLTYHIVLNNDDEGNLVGSEGNLVKTIVNCVLEEIKKVRLEVAKHHVGLDAVLRDFETATVESIRSHQNVPIVGIVGIGGSGKTTLAKELYSRKCSMMHRSSFLFDVRYAAAKNALLNLQKKLADDLLPNSVIKDLPFCSINDGKIIVASRMRSVRVLIVLDDVDHPDQLDALLPGLENVASGSLIIVTSRELGVLTSWGISSIYQMKGLDRDHATQLLCWHAFLQPYPHEGFEGLIGKFVDVCNELPLCLRVFGGQLYRKPKAYWESQLNKISRLLPEDIKETLKCTYGKKNVSPILSNCAEEAMGTAEMRRHSPPLHSPTIPTIENDDSGHHDNNNIRGVWGFFSPRVIRTYCLMNFWRRMLLLVLCALLVVGIVSLPPVWNSLNPPYLCTKDGIFLHCPQVKESRSLWENPYSATISWKPCAERHKRNLAYVPSENDTNGYILINAEGGLNQQRIAICNAVAVAKILNATLILPILKQDQIWKDQTKFEDVFDVNHFIEYLKYDVRIVRDIPAWFPEKEELFTSIRRTVKNIPKYASAEFYIDNVLPRIKEKKIMALKPFVDRLGYDNVPPEINRLRCRVNYHALRFLPEVEKMAEVLVSRMRNHTGKSHPYMALHLRFEKGMVGLSFCDFVGTREEKATMAAYRQKEWPRRYKNGSHLWQVALEKRKEGRCPLEPGEVAFLLRAMGYPKETQIYVASGQVYGGKNRMAPLRNMFPNLVTKEELTTKEELKPFRKHITSLAALDFLVCLKSDVFVMTHGGNFAKLIIGARRYMGHRLKSIKPNKALMARSLGDPFLGWGAFIEDIVVSHDTRTGLPEATFPGYDIWENPLSHCMCRA